MALLAVVVDRALKSVNTFRVFSNVGKIQGTSKYKLVPSALVLNLCLCEKRLYHQGSSARLVHPMIQANAL